ncbi:phage major capsid protein [Fodinibius salsisoli]|uniref:Phage major capsid protein n=1 Tax=Fodinibius salsisoli TaxID=2820877 RepID=A0ABT3PP92_9BACT|nr:phage major capsid protein [Fodinibius salsisoli]MCW9707673.1 phage major capsid protein [Fodinibius salsisoli]
MRKTLREIKTEMNDKLNEMTQHNESNNVEAYNSAEKEFKELEKKYNEAKKDREINDDNYEKIGSNNLNQEIQMNDNKKKTKLYNSADRLYTPSNSDIQLEDALTAIVDKPITDEQKDFINNSVTSDNYELSEVVSSQIIDRVRKKNKLIQAGALTAQVDNNTKYITVDSTPNAVFHEELVEETADTGDHFGSIKVDSNTVMSHFVVSREMMQDSRNGGDALSLALTNSLSNAIMEKSYTASGSAEPSALNSKVTQTQTYSGSVTHGEFVKANRQLIEQNVEQENVSFIYSPATWEDISLSTDNNGRYQDAPSTIRDVPTFTDANLSNGTAYVGDASNLIYAFQMNVTLEKYNSVTANRFGTTWLAVARYDLLHLDPSSFVRIESQ